MPSSPPGPTASADPFTRIVVPVQGTDQELDIQRRAVEIGAALGVPVRALHVAGDPETVRDDLFDYLEGLADKWGTNLETDVIGADDVASALLDELDPLDLVVLGTRNLGTRYHVGSVAEALIRRAPCPVTVLRMD